MTGPFEHAPPSTLVNRFLTAPTWPVTFDLVAQHPELLGDETLAMLAAEAAARRQHGDDIGAALLDKHRVALVRIRTEGAERVEAELLRQLDPTDAKSVATFRQALTELGEALVPETRPIVERYPVLLTDAGDRGMRATFESLLAGDHLGDALVVAERRMLLRRIRRLGYEQVYDAIRDSANTEEHFRRLMGLAAAHGARYNDTGDPTAIDDALADRLEISRRMAETVPTEMFAVSEAIRLAATFLMRYLDQHEYGDLLAAIARLEYLLRNVSGNVPVDAVMLATANLARAYTHRYAVTGDERHLDRADELVRRYASAVTDPDSVDVLLREYVGIAWQRDAGRQDPTVDVIGRWRRSGDIDAALTEFRGRLGRVSPQPNHSNPHQTM